MTKRGVESGKAWTWREIKDDVNISDLELKRRYEEIAKKAKNPDHVKFTVTYDFQNPEQKRARIRRFYRNLEKLLEDGGWRKTRSEITFKNLEAAERVRTLAQECGAKAYMSASIEIE
ncbi:hypothetical protein AKJ42_01195 [candidate division MSBL1 archaeon SCGC-AAA261C02]|uniref:Uncharacterized protein n=1 Tax=candidate division MSBL1 archaeon SCGC-AAA261C02 TaxID=1698272 RepID=A0A133V1F2_9EURY|nr:hypothetical protein AKJ42_01195 [candidate division MSBL1 archaeon SCGC-AAA261C02]